MLNEFTYCPCVYFLIQSINVLMILSSPNEFDKDSLISSVKFARILTVILFQTGSMLFIYIPYVTRLTPF